MSTFNAIWDNFGHKFGPPRPVLHSDKASYPGSGRQIRSQCSKNSAGAPRNTVHPGRYKGPPDVCTRRRRGRLTHVAHLDRYPGTVASGTRLNCGAHRKDQALKLKFFGYAYPMNPVPHHY
eukprot:2088393-Rhodomonas_salina.4